jgi:hypothetical protein
MSIQRFIYLIIFSFIFGAKVMASEVIEVYTSTSCGCSQYWISHLKQNGFTVKEHRNEDMTVIKDRRAVPASMASCHTA